ncbi:MAG: hypothetical protein O7J95_18920 [Planctomycetota bacterium]|nr:hypothetical protein [Planctomycetota bacterium]
MTATSIRSFTNFAYFTPPGPAAAGLLGVRSVLLAAVLLSPALAVAADVSRSYTRYTGDSDVGAKLVTSGRLTQTDTLVRASAGFVGSARLFGGTYEAIRVDGSSQVENGASSNVIRVKVAGYTVYSVSRSYGWSWGWSHSQTFLDRNKTIWVIGIPINCEIRVGGTIYANLSLGVSVAGAGLQGQFGSNVWGSATAAVDLVLYRAGVRSDITLFDNWLEPSLTAGFSGIVGSLDYVTDPITVYLRLVLDRAKLKKKGWRWRRVWTEVASYTLTSWSGGSFRRNILSV